MCGNLQIKNHRQSALASQALGEVSLLRLESVDANTERDSLVPGGEGRAALPQLGGLGVGERAGLMQTHPFQASPDAAGDHCGGHSTYVRAAAAHLFRYACQKNPVKEPCGTQK